MIKVENIEVFNFEGALRGMRAKGYKKTKMVNMKLLLVVMERALISERTKRKQKRKKWCSTIEKRCLLMA